MSAVVPPPWVTEADYHGLSKDAKALMWQILNGSHEGAHPATDTPAEREAVAARCVVSDGDHIWVAQEVCHLVPGPDMTPTEPGFYWRRVYHFGDNASPGWRWAPTEVYRPYGAPADAPLMTNGHDLGRVTWGPRLVPPPDPVQS